MRTLLIAITIAALTTSAYAQGTSGGKHRRGSEQKTDQTKTKVDEKAYQSALKGLPDQKYDPWHNMREKAPPK